MNTTWTDILPLVLKLYGRKARADQCKLLNLTENATYFVPAVSDEPESIIVRLNRPDYRDVKEVVSEQLWIKALKQAEVGLIPNVVLDSLGHDICLVDDQMAIATQFIDGGDPARESWVRCFGELGSITARMHVQARAWQLPSEFTRPTWNLETLLGWQSCYGTWAQNPLVSPTQAQFFAAAEQKLRKQIAAYGQGSQRFGLIHSDLRISNILVTEDDRLYVIDFDDCGFSWFMFDLACALSFIETEPEVPDIIDAWLTGYQSEQPLAPADIDIIPAMIMMRRLQMTAWMEARKETDFAATLREQDFVGGTQTVAERYLADTLFAGVLSDSIAPARSCQAIL